ncbi:MAG TPA: ABC transporter ATP-binding protein [Actinomycetota bacterium]|nr:ABC transporter ATP-binding protein [Actinomycetota bacterium]
MADLDQQVEAAPALAGAAGVAAIELAGARKAYGDRVALHGLDLRVEQGEVFGFLGPNGAGKTTAMKILTGLVRASAGVARVLGRPVGDPAARRRIGYLPEHFRFQEWATGEELLDLHGRLAGLPAARRAARVAEVLELVGLAGRGRQRIRSYSKGMTQRIGLAQALLAEPELVLLDEPTSALDPVGRREVRDLIRELRGRGVTVFLNSHLLGEVELVCDRVAIIDQGRVVRGGRLAELVGPATALRLLLDRVDEYLLGALRRLGQVRSVEGVAVTLQVDDLDVAPAVAECVVRSGYRLFELAPVQRSLEEVFVDLVHGGDR